MSSNPTPTAPEASSGGAGSVSIDSDAFFSGAAPESAIKAVIGDTAPAPAAPALEPPPTPASEPPAPVGEQPAPQETKPEEPQPEPTAEEPAEPLPQKLEDMLRAVRQKDPALARELNKVVREDHFLLNGPTGFKTLFPGGPEEAQAYKLAAPTTEDLQAMQEYNSRYENLDQMYVSDPQGFVRVLMEDREAAIPMAAAFEPTLRQLDPGLYAEMARPFNENFWGNIMARAQREGTPEEIELLTAIQNRWLGGPPRAQQQAPTGWQRPPQVDQERARFEAEKAAWEEQRAEEFFADVKKASSETFMAELRKHVDEKMGSGVADGMRAKATAEAANAVWRVINTNPLIQKTLARVIEGGNRSPLHQEQAVNAVLNYARAHMLQASAPVIQDWLNAVRGSASGNGNATKPIASAAGATKDVGTGSTPHTGPIGAPRGFPPGWNVMNTQQRADSLAPLVDWRTMGDEAEADYIFMQVVAGKMDPSKLILKARG